MELEVALGVITGWADLGGLLAHHDVTAVAALPHLHLALGKDLRHLHIVQQGAVTLLVVLLDGGHQKELLRQLKGIGSNINRLTVLANMGKVQLIGLEKAAGELSEVSAALRAVMEGR